MGNHIGVFAICLGMLLAGACVAPAGGGAAPCQSSGESGRYPNAPMSSAYVTLEMARLDALTQRMCTEFDAQAPAPDNKEWVRLKLAHMADLEGRLDRAGDMPDKWGYTDTARRTFMAELQRRQSAVDRRHSEELRSLLQRYGWFRVSEFGQETERQAWQLLESGERDLGLQRAVLAKTKYLLVRHEANPAGFARLFDRVAVREGRPQCYGTQGTCGESGLWEPAPIEDPGHVDRRRAEVGLPPLAVAIERASDDCQ